MNPESDMKFSSAYNLFLPVLSVPLVFISVKQVVIDFISCLSPSMISEMQNRPTLLMLQAVCVLLVAVRRM